MTSYLMTTVMFAISLSHYLQDIRKTRKNVENKGQDRGGGKRDLRRSIGSVRSM